MLTPRAWWLVFIILCLLALASLIPQGHRTMALIGMVLLLWFLFEWFRFAVGAKLVVRQLHLTRELRDGRGVVDCLWAGRTFEVRLRVRLSGLFRLSYAHLTDRLPFGVLADEGEREYEGEVAPWQPVDIHYRLTCLGAGLVRFEGIAVKLADLQGLFYHTTFISEGRTYRVMPVLSDAEGTAASRKRHNLLPPPGVHRQRRPGAGSELLDLRDYFPGDPPKLIAWKVSARRDRLITKEFESEVPVRCTLYLDTSDSVRVGGPGNNALTRLVEIAARVTQSTLGNRDLIGLTTFDEAHADHIAPARTKRHLIIVLQRLADAGAVMPGKAALSLDRALPLAYSFAEEVYPDWLRNERNSFPVWLPWVFPQPAHTVSRPTLADRLNPWYRWLLPAYVVGAFALTVFVLGGLAIWLNRQHATILQVLWILGLAILALTLILVESARFPFRRHRHRYRWRKKLAALLSVQHGLAPGGLAWLLEDDDAMAQHVQRFLADHQVPLPLTLYDEHGRYVFASPAKVERLAKALLQSVSKGRDNELFVLLADLLELTDHLPPLLRAIKVARARHHQVMVVCPWPPGIPAPGAVPEAIPITTQVDELVFQTTVTRMHQAFAELRRTLARLGVIMICAQDHEPARLIMDRLDRLRTVRSAPRFGRH